ncbi:MAG TPA: helix-turn-helix transcriptional regulator [Mycobacterium sp.]|nr:helix-turn-helix transcriptional regulator [Mycobacterium sp.]
MSVSSGSGHSAEARELGAILRRLRDARGLTTRQLGERIGVTSANFTYWERGDRLIPANHLASSLDVLEPDDAERERMLGLHRKARPADPGLLVAGAPNIGPQLVQLIEYEQTASRLIDVEPLMIPGLLQTADYARAAFAGLDDVNTRVALRMGRRDVITRAVDPVDLTAYVDSEVLVRPIAPPDVMVGQLRHLLEMAQRPNITIRLVSSTHPGYNPMLAGPFLLIEFPAALPIVHLEHYSTGAFLDKEPDVRTYVAAVEQVDQIAMTPARTAEVIAELLNGMETT